MFLETFKSLVIRYKKAKAPTTDTQLPPIVIKDSDPSTNSPQATLSDQAPFSANASNGLDPSAKSAPGDQHTPAILGVGSFPYSHDFVIHNLNITAETINSGGTVQQLLAQKRIPGAEVDSSARDPPPKCHPDTRKSLKGRIIGWFNGSDRQWRMLWILGPMGVGKSAVAQTIAEEFNASGRLGAALFFSRPNHRDDPEGVISTLAFQLAIKYPEYKYIITQRLAGDPTILEKNRRTQFKELIIEPFRILMTQNAQVVREPLLIILDGLDECKSKEAQCEFVELISDHVRHVGEFPLLWMICSRPEWHLKGLLSHPDFQVTCMREEISIDDSAAQQDVARVLQADFKAIRRKYYDRLDASWPPEADIRRISVTASGHFAFASTIIRFVGDEYRADPCSQLNICIRFLGGSGIPGAANPLHALDLLYRQILSDVPGDTLPATMRVLGLLILYPHDPLVVHAQAKFLCLDQATFRRSLQNLHSVLDVPSVVGAHHDGVKFYHASFAEYLSDPLRSGPFAINKPAVHLEAAIHSLKWQKRSIPAEGAHSAPRPGLEQIRSEIKEDKIVSSLRHYSSRVGWRACCDVSDEDVPRVIAELERFDFRDIKEQPTYFVEFLAWLYKLGDRNNSLVHVVPVISTWDTVSLSVSHETEDMEEYLSVFDSRCSVKCVQHALLLELGQRNNACDIRLTMKRKVSNLFSSA